MYNIHIGVVCNIKLLLPDHHRGRRLLLDFHRGSRRLHRLLRLRSHSSLKDSLLHRLHHGDERWPMRGRRRYATTTDEHGIAAGRMYVGHRRTEMSTNKNDKRLMCE